MSVSGRMVKAGWYLFLREWALPFFYEFNPAGNLQENNNRKISVIIMV